MGSLAASKAHAEYNLEWVKSHIHTIDRACFALAVLRKRQPLKIRRSLPTSAPARQRSATGPTD